MRCLHLDPLLLHLRKILCIVIGLPPSGSLPPPSPADAQLVEGLSASVFVFFSAFSPAVQLSGTVLFPLVVCLLGEALVPVCVCMWCVCACGVCVRVVCVCVHVVCYKLFVHSKFTPHTPHTPHTHTHPTPHMHTLAVSIRSWCAVSTLRASLTFASG